MKKLHIFIVTGILMGISLFCFAGVNETLPTHHWAYNYIEALQVRGYLLELNTLQLPYTRGEIARQLVKEESGKENWSLFVKEIFHELLAEFSQEINVLNNENNILLRGKYEGFIDNTQGDKQAYRGIYRIGAGFNVGERIFIYSSANFDQYDYNDPDYMGYKWRGISAYMEQAYVQYRCKNFNVKFGRDFLKWGVGQSGTLVFSNNSRPLDQLYAEIRLGHLTFSYVIAELDPMKVKDKSNSYFTANRFLSGHRAVISLFANKLQAGVSEIVIYGGENKFFNMVYINPVMFYHGTKKNGAGDNNVLPTIDVLFYPVSRVQIYSSILIDDIQVEKTCPGDLEPNEIAWLAGGNWADPFGFGGVTLNAEYVRVANRTYKTPNPWETFIFRNDPLGHPLGNDFDRIELSALKMFGPLWITAGYSYTRKGEGSIYTPFDTPWFDYTVEQGYSEPFPTGVVEKRSDVSFKIQYLSNVHWGFNGEIHFLNKNNAGHVQGTAENDVLWKVGVWWDGSALFEF